MLKRTLSLLIVLCMLLSLLGCTSDQNPTTAPSTQATTIPTEPEVTEPDAQALYAQAKSAVENAAHLNLTISATRKRTVNGESYSDASTQIVSIQDLGQPSLRITVQDSTTIGNYVLTAQEFYSEGNVKMLFESTPFTAPMEADAYLARFAPAAMLDETIYETITQETTSSGTTIMFADPTAGESWLVPESAELISATGSAQLNPDGTLIKNSYAVTYRFGPTEYQLDYTISVTQPESQSLVNTLPASQEEYISLDYIDAPWILCHAGYDLIQTNTLSSNTIITTITQAAGAVFSVQEGLDIYRTDAESMYRHSNNLTLQDYSGNTEELEYTEILRDNKLTLTMDDAEPSTHPINHSQAEELLDDYLNSTTDALWEPKDLVGATFEDLGSVYLLEMKGSDVLGDDYEATVVSAFWEDPNFLRDMADAYSTTELTAYLSIDKYTQLPVAFGYSFEGIHAVEGQEYVISNQVDKTFFLGSTAAYEAITEEPLPDTEPETPATPLFYHVTGENGQEMWLIGTIHVGDDRTGFLPQQITDALLSSDALAVEFDTDAFDEALETDDKLVSQVQEAYFYPDNSMAKDHLEEELYEKAVKVMKATGNYFMNAEYLHPYLWSQSIDNFMLQQGYDLIPEKGVDNRLLRIARDNHIEIRDIESGLFQIQMITGFSDELQALLLEESLETDSAAYCEDVRDLYEKWCAGDEAVLREELSDEVDTSELTEEELAEYEESKHLLDEYNKAMSYDRNDGMLKAAISYLESGETIFYAVGLAHLLNDVNGLVDTLRDAGYTVELVSYN